MLSDGGGGGPAERRRFAAPPAPELPEPAGGSDPGGAELWDGWVAEGNTAAPAAM